MSVQLLRQLPTCDAIGKLSPTFTAISNSCWTPVSNRSCCASCSTSQYLRLLSEGLSIGIWFNANNVHTDSWCMGATISYSLIMRQMVAAASQHQSPRVDPKLGLLSVLSFACSHCVFAWVLLRISGVPQPPKTILLPHHSGGIVAKNWDRFPTHCDPDQD